jgi:hypothetical protein
MLVDLQIIRVNDFHLHSGLDKKTEFGPIKDENNSMTSKCFGTKSNSHRENVGKYVNIHGTLDYSPRT